MRKIRNLKQLAAKICRREGKKEQVNIAQVSEIIGVLSDLAWAEPSAMLLLYENGSKRAAKKKTHRKKVRRK